MREKIAASKILCAALAGLLALPAGLLPGRAFASEMPPPPPPPPKRPSLAVVGISLDESGPAAARLAWVGEQVGRRLARHQVLSLATLLDPDAAQLRSDKAEEGNSTYEQARKFYDELDLQKAVDRCDKSISAFEKSDLSANFEAMTKAWMLRIASLIANAENQTAGVELNSLLPVDQKSVFDPNLFAPDFIAQVKQRREEIRAKANLTVDITARPVSARIFVDGSYRGVTPMEVRDLAPGEHFMTLIAPGYQLIQKRVRPGVAVAVVESLSPAQRYEVLRGFLDEVRGDFRGSKRNAAAAAFARELGVDQVLVIGVSASGKDQLQVIGVRVDAKDGHELSYLEEPVPNDEARFGSAADGFLNRLIGSDTKRVAGKGPKATTGGSFQWQTRYTGYALAGVGVLALASGIIFGLQASSAMNDFKTATDAQTSDRLSGLESSGKSSALIADISYLVALISGGTGAYLAITDRGPSSADDANPNIDEKRTVTSKRRDADGDDAPPAKVEKKKDSKKEPAKVAPKSGDDEERPAPKKKKGRDEDDLRDD